MKEFRLRRRFKPFMYSPLGAEKIYHYLWHTFADIHIEKSKLVIFGSDETAKKSAQKLLRVVFFDSLKLLHPFMPFVTEELWSLAHGRKPKNFLMLEKWPLVGEVK
jgi:valyl-tRNA synthetase